VGLVVLQEVDGVYTLYTYADFSTARQVFDQVWYEPGSYLVVPVTSGGLLQRPFAIKKTVDWASLSVEDRFEYHDYRSTFVDIFRKLDLSMDRVLDEDELNKFGTLVGLPAFQNFQPSDFAPNSKRLEGISYRSSSIVANNYGLSEYGFI
jgi:hypothetical protein